MRQAMYIVVSKIFLKKSAYLFFSLKNVLYLQCTIKLIHYYDKNR